MGRVTPNKWARQASGGAASARNFRRSLARPSGRGLVFQAREAAIATLDAAEVHIGNQGAGQFPSLKHQVPDSLAQSLEKLKLVATQYLDLARVDEDATTFCQECGGDDPVSILRKLVYRDGHVLRLIGDEIKPGAAFRGSIKEVSANDEEPETPNGGAFHCRKASPTVYEISIC